ncbi:MAG: L,D-transpeptidase [Clostridia bacterium]
MQNKLLTAVILILSLLILNCYAEPDKEIIREIEACPDEEVISVLSSYQYIEALKSMGYYKLDYKDKNINIRNAILRFQSDCNLTADGVQGKRFKSAMIKRLMVNSNFRSPDIIAKAPSNGRWITINRTKKTLTLYMGKNGIHGNNSPYSIGRAVSKGCIRMINTDVLGLCNMVSIGTPVWIGNDETLRKWGVTQKSFY